jgi:hypothetical protein
MAFQYFRKYLNMKRGQSSRSGLIGLLVMAAVLLVFSAPPAYAYIDPGSGSFMLQMLLAGFFTLLFMLKNLRTKVVNFVRSLFKKRPNDRPE